MALLNLTANLGLNGSGFAMGLKQAQSQAKQSSAAIKSMFLQAFGAAAIISFSKNIIDTADELLDLEQRLGVSTQSLQEWRYAAKRTGASAEDVTKFFEKLAKSRDMALAGGEKQIENYQKLGASLDGLKTNRLQDIGKIVGNTVRKGDVQKLTAALQEIGGEAATKLIPMFRAGLDEMAEASRNAGQVLNDDVLEKLDAIKESSIDIAEIFTGPWATSLAFVVDQLTKIYDFFNKKLGPFFAYFGAIAGGAEPWSKEALDAALAAQQDAEAKPAQREEARQARRSAKESEANDPYGSYVEDKRKGAGKEALDRLKESKKNSGRSTPDVNSWQQIGGAVSSFANMVNPMVSELQKHRVHLRKIEKNTDRIKRVNVTDGGFSGF